MFKKPLWAIGFCLLVLGGQQTARGEYTVRSFVKVKGQEANFLHGIGVVVGLKNGNGDPESDPTLRALFQVVKQLSNTVSDPKTAAAQLKGYKNVALVTVTATIPPEGAREGELLDCRVQALGAKNLEGGRLFHTTLTSNALGDDRVFARAQGTLIADPNSPTTARIERGTQLVADFYNEFVHKGNITLIVKENHAGFAMAHEVAMVINESKDFQSAKDSTTQHLARALDARNVIVRIPNKYKNSPVEFVSYVLGTRFIQPPKKARVVIRRRAGLVVIDPNVEIRPVAVTHKSLAIAPDGGTPIGQFVEIDTDRQQPENTTKLQSLVNALKALKVPTDDIIEIIISINRSGALYGELIIEP